MPQRFGRDVLRLVPSPHRPRFYLGIHFPYWLWKYPFAPFFVSDARLRHVKTLKPTSVPWALDSGGFTEVMKNGRWISQADDYAVRIKRYAKEITHLEWAAPQDWMCGPKVLKATGLTVPIHQERTIDSVVTLRSLVDDVLVIPVLQGQTADDYLRHLARYEQRGFNLAAEPRVGLGSIFQRQSDDEVLNLIVKLKDMGIKLHAFGFKKPGLLRVGHALESADSMAWSYNAMKNAKHPDCMSNPSHKHCGNCIVFAKAWVQALHSEVMLNESLDLALGRVGLHGSYPLVAASGV